VLSPVVSPLSQREKLLQSIIDNPKDVRFEDACRAAELIGFEAKGQNGSHNSFSKSGDPEGLNFQNRNGKIVPYQAKQLGKKIQEYLAKRDDDEQTGKE
jgi:hypothetical protein